MISVHKLPLIPIQVNKTRRQHTQDNSKFALLVIDIKMRKEVKDVVSIFEFKSYHYVLRQLHKEWVISLPCSVPLP